MLKLNDNHLNGQCTGNKFRGFSMGALKSKELSDSPQKKRGVVTTITSNGEQDGDGNVLDSRHYNALGLGNKFTKISAKETGVTLEIEETIDDNNSKSVVIKSADKPHKDFTDAVGGLRKLVRHILGWPDTYAPLSLHISGVSFSYSSDKGTKGIVITGWVKLEKANAPFCFNTPYLPYEGAKPESNVPVVPDFGVKALNTLEMEAVAYIKGKRAQLDMFNSDKE